MVGSVISHNGFGAQPTYDGIFTVTAINSTTNYEIAAITFIADDDGDSNYLIDGVMSGVDIVADGGDVELYSTGTEIFGIGA